MEQSITLNLPNDLSDLEWAKVNSVYKQVDGWMEKSEYPCWYGTPQDEYYIYASIEPGGLLICGIVDEMLWNGWITKLCAKLTLALGKEIFDAEMQEPPESIDEVEKARQLFLDNAPLLIIKDAIWFGYNFHTSLPIYEPKVLSIAFDLYDRYKDSGSKEDVAHCMLLLGRIFTTKGEYLPACQFFLRAKKLFTSNYGIIAMEFFRETLRAPEAKKQIGLSRSEFEEQYQNDTPQKLSENYRRLDSD